MGASYLATPAATPLQYNVPTGWNPSWTWSSATSPYPPGYPPGDPTGGAEGPEPAVHSFIFTVTQSGQEIGAGYRVTTHVSSIESYIPPPMGIIVGWTHQTHWVLTGYPSGDGVSQYINESATKNRGYAFRVYVEINNRGSFTVEANLQHYKDGELVGTYDTSLDYDEPDQFGTLLESFELAHIVIDGEQAVASSEFGV